MHIDEPSDADLWARLRAGDTDAVDGLYDRYADRLHAYCFRRTGSYAQAQDLASTIWLEAWRTRNRARPHEGGSLAPWLFGIARNVVRNSDRSQRRHRAALARLPGPPAEPDHAEGVAGRLDDERRMQVVLEAVTRLPRHQQDVLTLVAWGGLSHTQTAAALGISPGTVKSRLSRAREHLAAADTVASDLTPTTTPRTTT